MFILIFQFLLSSIQAMDFKLPDSHYQQSTISSEKYQIAIHKWKKKGNKKHALTVHGYLDHCRYLAPIHKKLLSNGYNITCYDLPGHGLSSGEKISIESFTDYEVVLLDVIDSLTIRKRNSIFLAHSTGNVGITNALLNNQLPSVFSKIIMISPLTRSYMWNLSITANSVLGKNAKIPVVPKKQNQEYKDLIQNDPYREKWIPVSWFRQLQIWNQQLKSIDFKSKKRDLVIIYGTKDTAIDQEHSLEQFRNWFPRSKRYIINRATHMPYYDKPNIESLFYQALLEHI